jgi:hypothetical protein
MSALPIWKFDKPRAPDPKRGIAMALIGTVSAIVTVHKSPNGEGLIKGLSAVWHSSHLNRANQDIENGMLWLQWAFPRMWPSQAPWQHAAGTQVQNYGDMVNGS